MNEIHRILSACLTLAILSYSHASSCDSQCEPKESTTPPSDGGMGYRLPDTLYPETYRVDILTNLADLNENFTFDGTVCIQVKCVKETNKIILHSKNLVIHQDNVVVWSQNNEESQNEYECQADSNSNKEQGCTMKKIVNHSYHDDYEFYIITLADSLNAGSVYFITIPYHGELNQGLAGYYRSSYKDLHSGETRWLAVTQFESTDARRALPCFDEPAFKAKFQVNLGHIKTRKSISNMNIASTTPIDGLKDWVWDQYEITVPMSTYLLAFVVTDFCFKSSCSKSEANEIVFRVWARRDALSQCDYATFVGPRVLEYFERYFGVKYPLPKLDMIAIPDFSSGAMENWGLITFREVALLYDPAVSTASSQPYVASVVAHEIAHQWFGNLVTMKWWTDLWLNEGFATYVSALGVHHLYPEWNSLDEEVVDNMMSVFALDSLKSSHPISVPIGHPREIAQIFDSISYKKGSFVLRMMNLFLGENIFTNGVRNYLKQHAFGNAEQDDLWECLTQEAHKAKVLPENVSVKKIMDSWTLQTGYPVISVIRNYQTGVATVVQERFLGQKVGTDEEFVMDKTKWWIPLSYTTECAGEFNDPRPKEWFEPKAHVTINNLPPNEWVIFNIQISGLYRVKYDTENWNKIMATLLSKHYKIALLNRVQLLEDSLELAKTGDIEYEIPFNIIKYLLKEDDYLPWKTALKNLGFIDKMLRFYPTYGYFRMFMKNLLEGIYQRLSCENYSNVPENLSKIKHQTLISAWACKFEVQDCKERATVLFQAWMHSPNPETNNPIPRDQRSFTYCTAIKYGGEKEWNFLWDRYIMSNVGNERTLILSSLSCTREIWLLNRFLDWSLDEKSGIRKQDSASVFGGVARGDIGYFLAKSFLKNRIRDIYNYFGPKATKMGVYLGILANQITSDNELKEMARFTAENERYFRSSLQAVKQGLENSKININWQRNFYEKISAYLRCHQLSG